MWVEGPHKRFVHNLQPAAWKKLEICGSVGAGEPHGRIHQFVRALEPPAGRQSRPGDADGEKDAIPIIGWLIVGWFMLRAMQPNVLTGRWEVLQVFVSFRRWSAGVPRKEEIAEMQRSLKEAASWAHLACLTRGFTENRPWNFRKHQKKIKWWQPVVSQILVFRKGRCFFLRAHFSIFRHLGHLSSSKKKTGARWWAA